MTQLTTDHVRWAYRLLLDREPEDEEWVREIASRVHGTQELRRNFFSTPEFHLKNPQAGPVCRRRTVVISELANGLRFYLDLADPAVSLNILNGTYEASELAWTRRFLERGDNAIDLGANLGLYAIHMAEWCGEDSTIYAFEPLSSNLELLRKTVIENDFAERVSVVAAATGEHAKQASMLYLEVGPSSGGSHLVEAGSSPPPGHGLETVPVVPLDAYPLKRPIRFIKMDIEGCEPLACRGAERLLAEDRPTILAEINPLQLQVVAGCTARDFIAEMAQRRYSCHRLVDGKLRKPTEEADTIWSAVFRPRH